MNISKQGFILKVYLRDVEEITLISMLYKFTLIDLSTKPDF